MQDEESSKISDSSARIGSVIKSARIERGLTIEQASERLRITTFYLSKIEGGEFSDLPAPAYVAGFLRSYAQLLELDSELIVGRYFALNGKQSILQNYKMPVNGAPPQRSGPVIASIVIVLMGLAYGSWYWFTGIGPPGAEVSEKITLKELQVQDSYVGREDRSVVIADEKLSSDVTSTQIKQASNEHFETSATQSGVSMKEFGFDSSQTGSATIESVVTGSLGNGGGLVVPSVQSEGQSGVSSQQVEVSVSPKIFSESPSLEKPTIEQTVSNRMPTENLIHDDNDNVAPRNSSAIANLREPGQEITIRAIASSWVEIIRDDGESVMAKLMRAGDSYVVDSSSQFYLSTGNAGGLLAIIGDDEPRPIGDIGEIVRDLPLVSDRLRKNL